MTEPLTTPQHDEPTVEPEAIHTHFGLSYANYLVLPRTLLQSMPDLWQTKFVALLDEMTEAFRHVPQAECYEVHAATEHIVNEMTESQLKQAGITTDYYRGETPPDGLSHNELAEWLEAHEDPEGPSYSCNGEELSPHERVLLPTADPVPHYNRGRTRITPAAAEETHVVADDSSNPEHIDDCPGCETTTPNTLRTQLDASRAYEQRLREQHDHDVAELNRLRATLAATRTKTLVEEADLIVTHCPDHSPQDQDGVWMDCHCDVADDMRRRAAARPAATTQDGAQ